MELLEYTKINNYTINSINGKQLSYGLIISLELVDLKTLKAYIKINLANSFIRPSKFPISTPIFFVEKLDNNLCLYIDY